VKEGIREYLENYQSSFADLLSTLMLAKLIPGIEKFNIDQ
jgi:hypothetical protein